MPNDISISIAPEELSDFFGGFAGLVTFLGQGLEAAGVLLPGSFREWVALALEIQQEQGCTPSKTLAARLVLEMLDIPGGPPPRPKLSIVNG